MPWESLCLKQTKALSCSAGRLLQGFNNSETAHLWLAKISLRLHQENNKMEKQLKNILMCAKGVVGSSASSSRLADLKLITDLKLIPGLQI